jgi:predicted small lipoprotein YifL
MKLTVAMAAVLALLSITGCAQVDDVGNVSHN